ncbi:glycosyltransferase [Streptomyces sp. AC495_CC817]|uniref:glycosyltransferase n=1 Tax=Streptomyces sp. AC495_CC817 TaxID=2823900 RepID=UPI001C264FDE|nr:glycosyltransferase [Streptomyces sp. AC495_CC817]
MLEWPPYRRECAGGHVVLQLLTISSGVVPQTQQPSSHGSRPRILSISFSPLTRDARVLRQIAVLAEFGDVTTVGFGPAPASASTHIEVPADLASLPQTVTGVARLAIRAHRSAEMAAPALAYARAALAHERFDLVVANDARALPLAFEAAHGAPVWADLHEWAPEEQSHILSWRLLVAPFMTALCRTYLPQCAAVTTVSPLIADLYAERFGVDAGVVRNARPFEDLVPSPLVEGRVRLVHSGVAVPERCIETLIDATLALDERFTLDLFLVFGDDDRYRRELVQRAQGSERITFHDPVAPHDLPAALNAYDLGVYLLKPTTTNHRFMLPNKFFDFVQSRIGVVFGHAVEIDHLIAEHGLGLTVSGFESDDLVAALSSLTAEQVAGFKSNSDIAARALSSEVDAETQREVLRRLLSRT